MDWTKDRQWSAIGQERKRLAADLDALTEHDWHTQSQCGSWTVQETLAHLTAAASIGRWRWLRSMAGARFNADLHNRRRLNEHLGGSPAETLQRFTDAIPNRIEPANATWAWLGEVIVHGTDIRRLLGITTTPNVDTVTFVAETTQPETSPCRRAQPPRGSPCMRPTPRFATASDQRYPVLSSTSSW